MCYTLAVFRPSQSSATHSVLEREQCASCQVYGGDEATSSAGTVVSAGATSLHWQTAKASLLIYLKPQT